MLAADRSLTLDEVLDTVAPLADYLAARTWPVAGAMNLTDRATIRRTLQELTSSGVLVAFDSGLETVWGVGPQQHLVAAFYRNTAIHVLVNRAIGELGLVAAAENGHDGARVANKESLRLRDLLKFDFFFPSRHDFAREMVAEMGYLDPEGVSHLRDFDADQAHAWLRAARPSSRTSCSARSSTPTRSSPTGWQPGTTASSRASRRSASSTSACALPANGHCSDEWRARSRSPSSCSSRPCCSPGTAA